MTAEEDSRILKAAPASSDDWDDETWAAWCRHVDRAHRSRRERIDTLEAENEQLRTELNTVRAEALELTRALGLNEEAAA